MQAIPVRIGSTILEEIENVYDDITKRAYEIFRDRCGDCTLDLEDWLEAEKQLLWKPEVELTEKRDLFVVKIAFRNIDPAAISLLVTRDDMVVQSRESFHYPRLFRTLHFPKPVNPVQVYAVYLNGELVVNAMKMGVSEAFGAVMAPAATRASRTVHR
jgi:HSP20 family molecular chaperone IbpA